MKYRIRKLLHFSASHQLFGLSAEHQCARLHGHNYAVEIIVSANELDDVGFIIDFGIFSDLIDPLDHRHLNDVLPFNPTAELIAACIVENIVAYLQARRNKREMRIKVGVSETPRSTAWCYHDVIVDDK